MLEQDISLPVSQPLRTLKDVFNWFAPSPNDAGSFCVATVPKRPTKRLYPGKPKTLVCHDMQGGYREDRFIQGYNSTTCYRITHWNFIDIFVYFSHNIVTIPPPCWINAGHRHGVKVLGTFITEWDDGAQYCSDILKDEAFYKRFAKQLVDISCYYNFDGWLINIENVIAESQVSNLVAFVSFLTKLMHHSRPDSEVIWYDSVTSKGLLDWQNELNSKNSLLFDACDGIFLNYTWSVEQLSKSASFAGETRKFDVYVGVDCFGRGCFGGGGWNTYLALQVIRQHDLSAAIFAPGWVMETQGIENFTQNQNRFWHLLMSYLYPHVATELPIVTSFCQGYGKGLFCNGHKLVNAPWTNLSCQQLQPTNFDIFEQIGPEEGIQIRAISYCTEEAYLGGGCLKINGVVNSKIKDSQVNISMFTCECEIKDPIFIALTFKVDKDDLMEIFLLLSSGTKSLLLGPDFGKEYDESLESLSVNVDGRVLSTSRQLVDHDYKIPACLKKNSSVFEPLSGESFKIVEKQCTGEFSVAKGWQSRYYIISEKDLAALKEIKILLATKSNALPSLSPFSFHLGEIKVMNINGLFPAFPKLVKIKLCDTSVDKKDSKAFVSTTLTWDLENNNPNMIQHYNIYCNNIAGYLKTDFGILIGRACINRYRVVNLDIPSDIKKLIFFIQPVSSCNIIASLNQCLDFTLDL